MGAQYKAVERKYDFLPLQVLSVGNWKFKWNRPTCNKFEGKEGQEFDQVAKVGGGKFRIKCIKKIKYVAYMIFLEARIYRPLESQFFWNFVSNGWTFQIFLRIRENLDTTWIYAILLLSRKNIQEILETIGKFQESVKKHFWKIPDKKFQWSMKFFSRKPPMPRTFHFFVVPGIFKEKFALIARIFLVFLGLLSNFSWIAVKILANGELYLSLEFSDHQKCCTPIISM